MANDIARSGNGALSAFLSFTPPIVPVSLLSMLFFLGPRVPSGVLVGVVSDVREIRVKMALARVRPTIDAHGRRMGFDSLALVILLLTFDVEGVDTYHLEHGVAVPLTYIVSDFSPWGTGVAPDSSASLQCFTSTCSVVAILGANVSSSHASAAPSIAPSGVTLTKTVVHFLLSRDG